MKRDYQAELEQARKELFTLVTVITPLLTIFLFALAAGVF